MLCEATLQHRTQSASVASFDDPPGILPSTTIVNANPHNATTVRTMQSETNNNNNKERCAATARGCLSTANGHRLDRFTLVIKGSVWRDLPPPVACLSGLLFCRNWGAWPCSPSRVFQSFPSSWIFCLCFDHGSAGGSKCAGHGFCERQWWATQMEWSFCHVSQPCSMCQCSISNMYQTHCPVITLLFQFLSSWNCIPERLLEIQSL